MKKNIVVLFFTILTAIPSYSQSKFDAINAVIQRLSEAISKGDKSLIINDLNPKFAVGSASWPSSEYHIGAILESKRLRGVTMGSIISTKGDTTLVKTIFTLADDTTQESTIAFDSQNRVLFIDRFDQFFGPSRYGKSELKGVIKFSRNDGSIIIPLKINNSERTLNFLFDSGADGMAISKALADSIGLTIDHSRQTSVVGGNMEVNISRGNTIHLNDNVSIDDQNIAIFEQMGRGADGIIGLNLAKKFILQVNVPDQTMSLYSFGDFQFERKGETIDITVPHNVIIIPATLNIVGKKDVEGNFVFDTGANYHLIGFEKFVRKNRLLLTGFKIESEAATTSMGLISPVFLGKASSFTIGKAIEFKNMPIALMGSTGRTDETIGLPDGSIGIKLITQFDFTIDLLRKIIHLTPNGSDQE